MNYHVPVLLEEILSLFNPKPGDIYIDCTVGNGGHSLELISRGAVVYGIDQDPTNLQIATKRINSSRFFPINTNFRHVMEVVNKIDKPIKGILFDLGLSSNQLMSSNRGFSFNDNLSLDMRLDPESQELTAEEVINTYSYEELCQLFTLYAQEQYSKPLAIKIINDRQKSPIKTGQRLANIIREYYKSKNIRQTIDPSTKIFMALRMEVNNEIDNLRRTLESTISPKLTGTTVAIISFHSGEDRIVKQFIRSNFTQKSKPIMPSHKEILANPLSRSAVLRSYKII